MMGRRTRGRPFDAAKTQGGGRASQRYPPPTLPQDVRPNQFGQSRIAQLPQMAASLSPTSPHQHHSRLAQQVHVPTTPPTTPGYIAFVET